MKPNTITPQEQRIVEEAYEFKVWHQARAHRGVYPTEAAAFAAAEAVVFTQGYKALVYAVADVCGNPTGACYASFGKDGWNIARKAA
jgi:hypothetical protein